MCIRSLCLSIRKQYKAEVGINYYYVNNVLLKLTSYKYTGSSRLRIKGPASPTLDKPFSVNINTTVSSHTKVNTRKNTHTDSH